MQKASSLYEIGNEPYSVDGVEVHEEHTTVQQKSGLLAENVCAANKDLNKS